MKTSHQTLWSAALLLLFLTLAVVPANAFYNPTSGRWLNRDPIEERGGNNLYAVLDNDTVERHDALGKCDPLREIDLGIRPSRSGGPNGLMWISSWVVSAVTERCRSDCRKYKARIRSCWASATFWYNSHGAVEDHERTHVAIAAEKWSVLDSIIHTYVDRCGSQRRANCYVALIDLNTELYQRYADAENYRYDCDTYGGSCAMADWQEAVNRLLQADVNSKERECETYE